MTFPTLSTGAVTQYPLPIGISYPATVIRFVDGADQRFATRGKLLRRWQIHLQLLNETEIARVEVFFRTLAGQYTLFDFPDPLSGTTVSNCRMASPGLSTDYDRVDTGAASFWVVETNA